MTREIKPTPLLNLHGKRINAELNRKRNVEKTFDFRTNRHTYVLLRWIPELQIYEYLLTVSSVKRAKKYLLDNFEPVFKSLGKTEFDRVYQIKKVRVV